MALLCSFFFFFFLMLTLALAHCLLLLWNRHELTLTMITLYAGVWLLQAWSSKKKKIKKKKKLSFITVSVSLPMSPLTVSGGKLAECVKLEARQGCAHRAALRREHAVDSVSPTRLRNTIWH